MCMLTVVTKLGAVLTAAPVATPCITAAANTAPPRAAAAHGGKHDATVTAIATPRVVLRVTAPLSRGAMVGAQGQLLR
jgi:hypothetical protein